MKNINETNYLNVSKTPIYRRIMRCFYEERENLKYNLYREEIFEKIKKFPELIDYKGAKEIDSELNYLVENGNLTAVQSPKKAQTLEEYKNKEFIYSMTEVAVIVERMTITLENLEFQSKSISTNFLTRIELELEKIRGESFKNWSLEEINQWWEVLQDNFKKLNESYQDYLHEFYGERAQRFMRTIEFIEYKDRLIVVLREFVRELQLKRSRLKNILDEVEEVVEKEIIELILKSELAKQELNINSLYTKDENYSSRLKENILKRWISLKKWFVVGEGKSSEYENLLKITDEIIEKIVQNAYYMTQRKNVGISRKNLYREYIKKFIKCESLEEAHRYSSEIFGVQKIRHFSLGKTMIDRDKSSVYEEEAKEYKLESHNRTYKPRVQKSGFEDKSLLKRIEREKALERLKNNKRMRMKYTKDGILDISKIDEEVSIDFRLFILNMISLASLNGGWGRTEDGQRYEAIKLDKRCVLKCEDGDLDMPVYIFNFLEE